MVTITNGPVYVLWVLSKCMCACGSWGPASPVSWLDFSYFISWLSTTYSRLHTAFDGCGQSHQGAHGSRSAHLQLCHPHSVDKTDSLQTGLCKRNRDLCIFPVPSLALCPQTQGSLCSSAICEQWGTMGQEWVCWDSHRIQILAGPFCGQDYHSYFSPFSSAEFNCSGLSSLKNEIYRVSPCWASCFNILRRLITSVCHHVCPLLFLIMTLKTYHIVGIIIPYTLCCCLRIWASTPSIYETLSPNKRVPSLSKLCILYSRQRNVFLACTHITNRSEAECMMELGCGNGGTSITISPLPSYATCADSDKIPGSRERICPRTQSPLCSYLPGRRKSVFLWPWVLREATGISLLY